VSAALWDVTANLPSSLMDISDFAPFVEGLDHPECVTCGPDGEVFAGGEAGQVYQVSLHGSFEQIGSTDGFLLGLCLDRDRNVYACDMANHAVMRMTPDGRVATYSSGTAEKPMVTPNYPVFDAAGNLYVSESGGWHKGDGCIFVVRAGGKTEVFTDKVRDFPNGMALHPSGSHLYCVVSQVPGVVKIRIKDDHSAGEISSVVTLPSNVPDGLAFDEEENLYISCYTPDVIYRLSPEGELALVAADWEGVTFATPTNVAFCGSDRKTLVVASLSRWHLTKGAMPTAGVRLNYPQILS
jgi:sugar lactone lactonase YvrE